MGNPTHFVSRLIGGVLLGYLTLLTSACSDSGESLENSGQQASPVDPWTVSGTALGDHRAILIEKSSSTSDFFAVLQGREGATDPIQIVRGSANGRIL